MLIEPTLRSDLLAGRTAIVTGGARGIGGATATMLAANGAHVVIAEVDATKAAETVAELRANFGDEAATAHVADLVAPGACDTLVEATLDAYGGLDIVVNNAGYTWDGGIHNMTDEQFQAMLDIHLIVPFRLARACAPVFRDAAERDTDKQRHRKTVMVSSLAGQWGLMGAGQLRRSEVRHARPDAHPRAGVGPLPGQRQRGRLRRDPDPVRDAAVRPRSDRDRWSYHPRRHASQAGRATRRAR